jgi:hypothetical protein
LDGDLVAGFIRVDAIWRLCEFTGVVAARLESQLQLISMLEKPADRFRL